MERELLRRYLENCCSEEELKSVLSAFEEDSRDNEIKSHLIGLWEGMSDDDPDLKTDFDLILNRIHHQINLNASGNLSVEARENPVRYLQIEKIKKLLIRAAAIMLLPVLLYSLFVTFKYESNRRIQETASQSYNEVFSSVDAITKVTLPDGTNVWLNHSSSLKYPSFFHGNSRTIELKGEGYFEVAHNSKVPFNVKAGDIKIQATGTTFNVLAYPEEDRIETSLISGHVEIISVGPDGSETSLLKMKPHDLAIYQTVKREINRLTINDDRYYSWKEGKLIFNEEPLSEVVKKLRRWYNVDIQIKDPELLDLTLTATFIHESFPQVLELLSLITPVSYSISAREEISNGNFTKRKVVLYKKKS